MFYYIYYALLKNLFYSNSYFFGLITGHISYVLTLMLTVSFVDGSS
jgi:hypothetical protein